MAKLINKMVIRRRHIIVDAEDVLHALSVIQSHHSVVPEMKVGNCGWAETNKWFIHFDCSNEKWELIRHELEVVRVFNNSDIPNANFGAVYSTD